MYIIFTDLDGTLLDKDYSFANAKKALQEIRKKHTPLIIGSSKTRAEIEEYRKKLRNNDPFIVENGGAIYIPKGYFDFEFRSKKKNGYVTIEIGKPYPELVKVLRSIKKRVSGIIAFSDLSVSELSKDTGLGLKEARLAKKREYDAVFRAPKGNKKEIKKLVEQKGLNFSQGTRYCHILSGDKGKAVKILMALYKKKYKNKKVLSIAIGDSENDFDMLKVAKKAILVQRFDGSYASPLYKHAKGIASKGWNKAVLNLLGKNE